MMPDRCYLFSLVVKWRTHWPRLWAATWTIYPQKDPPGSQAKHIRHDFSRTDRPIKGQNRKKHIPPPTFLLDHLIIGLPTRKTEKSHRIALAETWTKAMPLVGLLISKALNDDAKTTHRQFGNLVMFPLFGSVGKCLKWLPDVGYTYRYILCLKWNEYE